jgi:unsaturated chondroitin disaccharide hydrolase
VTLPKLRLKPSRSAAPIAAALIAAAAVGCGGSAQSAQPASSVALGRVRVFLHVDTRTRFRVPAAWAASWQSHGRHLERAGSDRGSLEVGPGRDLIISSTPAALLLQRLAELHARLKPGQFPLGTGIDDHLFIKSPTYWTSGFWPGALWQAAALAPRPFKAWALAATLKHLGHETTPTHDVGFMYGQSSLAAYQALCHRSGATLCRRLKKSVVAAAGELVKLENTNRRAGTIPTNPYGPRADTIVDSMMNIAILPWASQVTGEKVYARVALRHARRVAALLVRKDGSTIQAVNFNRRTGRVISRATHQGLSERSTWSRGQGWAVYGFAQAARELRDQSLFKVALRTASYVASHLPPAGVPLWDYDAHRGPVDVSAGVITAAGLLHLTRACRQFGQPCPRYGTLARHMLAGALAYSSPTRPLGLLRGQELNHHAPTCWCNGGELIFGLSYALEAVRLAS